MKRLIETLIFCLVTLLATAQPPQTVNIGSGANMRDGDPLRQAFSKLNTNDAAAYDSLLDLQTQIDVLPITVQVILTDTISKTSDSTKYILIIGEELDGMNLVKMEAKFMQDEGNKVPVINLYRMRSATEVAMTSTGANFTTNAVINGSNDNVEEDDRLRFKWTLGAGANAPEGIICLLTFQMP